LPLPSTAFNPHEVIFSPDGSKYYVTCIADKTVRVFNASTDALISVINVDGEPQEMAVSSSKNLLFVALTSSAHFSGKNGAVAIVDISANALHATTPYVYTGTQPHGLSVSESKKVVYVANRNIDVNGSAPHHSSVCGGRNGYVTLIDLYSLSLTGKKTELSDDVYSLFVRE
jgi:DNA-binding beta-propeller fold protein YncE